MLRSIILCPDQDLAQRLEVALTSTGIITVGRILDRYPNAIEVVRTLRAQSPDVIFLSFESVEKAQEVIKQLETESDGVQVVAIHQACDAQLLRDTMRLGVREFLSEPFERAAIMESLSNVSALLAKKPPSHTSTDQIFSFLPSKAGVGTSTLALNVSAALARRAGTRVLLSDFDLNSGMLRFMLKLTSEYSVVDAVERAVEFDENLWPQLVTTMDNLDVLHAGRINPHLRIEGSQIRTLVGFMRRNYQALCFDLSGNLERYSIELMQESKRVLLVCTPEISSLHLAREKLHFLRNLELDSRVAIILNRCHKKPMFSKQQVEEILGMPVWKTFPNDYHGVNRALAAGRWIDPNSDMGKAFSEFAGMMVEKKPQGQGEKHKFLQFFSVSGPGTLVSSEK